MLVRTTNLELSSPAQLVPSLRVPPEALLLRAGIPSPELSRFLYTAVGGDWYWRDRIAWTFGQWMAWLSRPELETWVLYVSGTPAGYFELEAQEGGQVEIVCFGLLPAFAGKGLGGHLLTRAATRGFQIPGTRRVWVHTCSLDHPAALANYQARGFSAFGEEARDLDVPSLPPGPWPGAERPR